MEIMAGGGADTSWRTVRVVLAAHGIVTLAAAVVLAVFPAAIPATVGIVVEADSYLLSYFLAAAELAIGLLSLGAVTLADARALRLIIGVFIVFHLATAILEIVYALRAGMTPVLTGNILVRVLAIVVFLVAGRAVRQVRQ